MTAPQSTGTAVALPAEITRATFKTDVERWAPEIQKVAYRGMTSENVLAAALQAAVHEPKLFEAVPQSLYLALMKCARWGLHIGDGVHLVPMPKNVAKRDQPAKWVTTVEAWPDYKGLKALAMRQGIVRNMEEFVVYQGDEFDREQGLNATLRHRPVGDPKKRGGMIGAYSIIRLPHSEKTFNYMSLEDIEAIRAKSKSWGPEKVKACPGWYAKKTVVRDYLNRQPKMGGELAEALRADDTVFDEETGEVFDHPAPQQLAAGEDDEYQPGDAAGEP